MSSFKMINMAEREARYPWWPWNVGLLPAISAISGSVEAPFSLQNLRTSDIFDSNEKYLLFNVHFGPPNLNDPRDCISKMDSSKKSCRPDPTQPHLSYEKPAQVQNDLTLRDSGPLLKALGLTGNQDGGHCFDSPSPTLLDVMADLWAKPARKPPCMGGEESYLLPGRPDKYSKKVKNP